MDGAADVIEYEAASSDNGSVVRDLFNDYLERNPDACQRMRECALTEKRTWAMLRYLHDEEVVKR
jgi:hypothetical protein